MAHDAVRQNALVNDGWTVLRFTYHRLIREPDAVIAEVRRALRR
jgi:very-short-patch-repair endonuclease